MGFLQLALREARRSGANAHHLEMADEQMRRMAGLIEQMSADSAGKRREALSL